VGLVGLKKVMSNLFHRDVDFVLIFLSILWVSSVLKKHGFHH
jgi:hypothetical protein